MIFPLQIKNEILKKKRKIKKVELENWQILEFEKV